MEDHVEVRLLELIRLRVSQIHECVNSVRSHDYNLRTQGETNDRLERLTDWQRCFRFSARERAALELCELIARAPEEPLPSRLIHKTRQFFTDSEIVEMTVAIMAVEDWILASS